MKEFSGEWDGAVTSLPATGDPAGEALSDMINARQCAGCRWWVPDGSTCETLRDADHYLVAREMVEERGYSRERAMGLAYLWSIYKTVAPWEWGDQTTASDLGATWWGIEDALRGNQP